ncbi:curli-like amyloid fiber formation chaperone CsgH [Paracandidimonas soli]|uniref:Curli assembly protein CsgC n=1 Tax=Paracandidimonas soli TaxID=1917182 RepID=A0A4R3VBT3_9BURK|nr:curli-like amyloid fiber formation chaperone CsgH [Paracandidimonas soli]TCV01551.1 curli production protein [Paracandidimonas soli]
MNVDADIQVWLETVAGTQPSVIVPYVQSAGGGPLHYEIQAVREGPQGRAVIRQGSNVTLAAGKPTALSNMAISRNSGETCDIVIFITGKEGSLPESGRSYQFPCPD